jgi:two-component system, NtrC family, response regulator AtoC
MSQDVGKVLVLDDERNIVTVLKAILEKRGFVVEGFTDPREALAAVRTGQFDAAVTDLYMPDIDGMAFLEEVRRLYPGLPVVMITAFGTVDSAVDAIKKGAFDYVTKPFEQSEIVSVVQKAVGTGQLKRMSVDRSEQMDSTVATFSSLFSGRNESLQRLQATLKKVVTTPSPVLILGETGTGKEFLAEEIHQLSDRSFQPLLKYHCTASTSLAAETDLFGGAKPGRFELAQKGSLFLDEVTDLSLELQGKLLEYLDTGTFEHPLSGERKNIDVRLIVATHRVLQKEVKEGRFREDLFYKLSVAPLLLPPLRERKEDMGNICDFFLSRLSQRLGRSKPRVSPSLLRGFQEAHWPGNLRQLEYVLERLLLVGDGQELADGPLWDSLRREMDGAGNFDGTSFREVVRRQTQNLERDLIEKALQEMDGNVTRTAEHLGISRKGLQIKMKELGIRD